MSAQVRRTGLIAEKVGMTQIFSESGEALAVTLLKAVNNYVVAHKTEKTDGYNSMLVGFGEAKSHRVSKSVRGTCAKAGVKPVKYLKEFRISDDAFVPVGSELSVEHFMEGQEIDIHGNSIGKGFAGGMKRWNFGGLEATHGVSISHRSHGSTGQCQDPGRVFKGKKMAGHLGDEKTTIQNITVSMIDAELGLIAVHGSVPGKKGKYVFLTDAIKKPVPADVAFPAALVEQKKVEEKSEAPAADESAKTE